LARHQFAVGALAAVAVASMLWLLLDVVGAYSRSGENFGVGGFESRFDDLRKALPVNAVVGYTSDNAPNDPNSQAEYYLTQYTLAPRTVLPSTASKLVVVNSHNPKPDRNALRKVNLVLVQDFGEGVFLCRNVTQ
jgi:hypothetical protein